MIKRYKNQRSLRHRRVRSKISGKAESPRISVFRSNKFITAQAVDDVLGVTLLHVNEKDLEGVEKLTKTQKATKLGEKLAKDLLEKNIKKVVFDRGGYKYHGRVEAVAVGARSGGLEF